MNPPPDVWGGVECTCNRVRDCYFDQIEFSGHSTRVDDIKLFAELGVKALRVGLLWERHELDPSWGFADARMQALREAGIRPIVGLVHHGSGPRHTSLLDGSFPSKLAKYAKSMAERYPWVDAYTPVNEPNTTARFSCLYGVWYPHLQSRSNYAVALLNQTRATVESMRAIRSVNPNAQLIQTEDVGQISGSEELRPVWEVLSIRRWISFDLLCGRIDRSHPLFDYLRVAGIAEYEILWFRENPCPPDVIGLNYYVTSDRYIDHRVDRFPPQLRSAEGHFVDVEAARVSNAGIAGFNTILEEAWERYRLPVALTEVHLGGEPDEQIRWATEAWNGMMSARSKGVQCVSITFWALLGSFYWNRLVTAVNGHYEHGAFDLRSGSPVPTDLTSIIKQIARGEDPSHPALSQEGWWRQESRACFFCEDDPSNSVQPVPRDDQRSGAFEIDTDCALTSP